MSIVHQVKSRSRCDGILTPFGQTVVKLFWVIVIPLVFISFLPAMEKKIGELSEERRRNIQTHPLASR